MKFLQLIIVVSILIFLAVAFQKDAFAQEDIFNWEGPKQAKEDLKRTEETLIENPSNAKLHFKKGLLCFHLYGISEERRKAVIGAMERAIELDPDNEEYRKTYNNIKQEISEYNSLWQDKYILILKSTKDYEEAVNFTREASEKLNLGFYNENIRYSKEKGIYFSEDIPDELYRGGYYPRRYAGDAGISLENSWGYRGFEPGYIIVVGGVFDRKEDSGKALNKAKEFYEDAYVKRTVMWMGCIH